MSSLPRLHQLFRVGCLLGLACLTQAQEVNATRAEFLKLVLSDSQILTDQYERALAKLESELAAGADYEEARLIQLRREEVKALYGQLGSLTTTGIPLSRDRARLSGTVEYRSDVLTGWRGPSSLVEWSGLRITPGSYYLELEGNITGLPAAAGGPMPGRSQPKDKASFVFYEVSLLPGAQENRRNFEIERSADDTTFSPQRIGPLTFTRSSITLRIAPTESYTANAISLRALRLVPVTSESIQSAPTLPEGDALITAQQKLQRELTLAQKPIIDSYTQELKEITNPEARDMAAVELKRLLALQKAPPDKSENLLTRMLRQLGGVVGFENLENAKLVPTDSSTGDHFTIQHDGRDIPIRLLWVRCAPLDLRGEGAGTFSKHFHIDESNAGNFARAAREFTLGYLDGKPLRILLRANLEKDGSRAALVFLPEVGLYQNVLVDQGLAMVEVPQKATRMGMMERGMISSLLDREQGAQRMKNGAWALNGEEKR